MNERIIKQYKDYKLVAVSNRYNKRRSVGFRRLFEDLGIIKIKTISRMEVQFMVESKTDLGALSFERAYNALVKEDMLKCSK